MFSSTLPETKEATECTEKLFFCSLPSPCSHTVTRGLLSMWTGPTWPLGNSTYRKPSCVAGFVGGGVAVDTPGPPAPRRALCRLPASHRCAHPGRPRCSARTCACDEPFSPQMRHPRAAGSPSSGPGYRGACTVTRHFPAAETLVRLSSGRLCGLESCGPYGGSSHGPMTARDPLIRVPFLLPLLRTDKPITPLKNAKY